MKDANDALRSAVSAVSVVSVVSVVSAVSAVPAKANARVAVTARPWNLRASMSETCPTKLPKKISRSSSKE